MFVLLQYAQELFYKVSRQIKMGKTSWSYSIDDMWVYKFTNMCFQSLRFSVITWENRISDLFFTASIRPDMKLMIRYSTGWLSNVFCRIFHRISDIWLDVWIAIRRPNIRPIMSCSSFVRTLFILVSARTG